MSEREVEAEIVAKGLTAARLTPAVIDGLIAFERYIQHVEGDHCNEEVYAMRGVNGAKPAKAIQPLTICVLVLRNGFTVVGHSAPVSPENFDAALGRKIAREKAREQIWALAGYELKSRLAAAADRQG